MASQQISSQLVHLMKGTVQRFDISSETYYHAILLFNLIQLKSQPRTTPEYFTIPLKKRNFSQKDNTDSSNNSFTSSETEYVKIHRSQMPEKEKLDLAVCFFLAHKLYQPYPLCLSYLMNHLEIDERFEEFMISLEKEFLLKLAYKIQNILPSSETFFASLLWDQFTANIDSACVDVRFRIKQIFRSYQSQNASQGINRTIIQPQLKSVQNQQSFNLLSRNIQIIVHHRALYQLYAKKSSDQTQDDVSCMKKIGLAINFVTILQQTQISFYKMYPFKQTQNSDLENGKNQYLQFVFNDFLNENYELNLENLTEQIQVIHSILHQHNKTSNETKMIRNADILSFKETEISKSNPFLKFIFGTNSQANKHNNYQQQTKCKNNKSVSTTKTQKQADTLKIFLSKGKSRSILVDKSNNSKKHLDSTIHQSNISQKAESSIGFQQTKKYVNSRKRHLGSKEAYSTKIQKPYQKFSFSYERITQRSKLKVSSNKHQNSAQNNQSHEGRYKVSQFVPTEM